MIQRKQTLFLLVSVIISAVTLFVPVGQFVPNDIGTLAIMYNICIASTEGGMNFKVIPLFIILALSVITGFISIFLFKNRILQEKLCRVNVFLLLVWYALFYLYAYNIGYKEFDFQVSYNSCLPVISMIFYMIARRSILADEKLVRSADRIR